MKKHNIYFAFLAFAAILAILAACGEGEIIDLSDESSAAYNDMLKARDALTSGNGSLIARCQNNPNQPGCEEIKEPSSSSEPPTDFVSSSSVPGGGSSSSVPGGGSSSSVPGGGSSSSQRSSSSVDPNAYPVALFTCKWEPSSVIAGKTASVSITLNPADEADGVVCTKKAYLPVKNLSGTSEVGQYILTPPIDVRFGGILQSSSGSRQAVQFPPEPSGQSATYSELKGEVTCSGGGKSEGTRIETCSSLTINKPPAASVTGTLAFTGAHSSSSALIYYIGETPTHNTVTLDNSEGAEYCGEIEYEATGWTAGVPLPSVTALTNITVKAKCTLSGQVLATATAAVVPNPSISGSCTWDARDNKFTGGSTATLRAPLPTIIGTYGRTCTGPNFAKGGVLGNAISSGLSVDNYDHADQKMTGITISANCGTSEVTPLPCPDITVTDPNAPLDTDVNLEFDQKYVFEVGNSYNFTCQKPARTLYCYSVGGNAASITIGSKTYSVLTWATEGNMDNGFGSCMDGILTVTANIGCQHKY